MKLAVRADKDAPWETVVMVMDAARDAKINAHSASPRKRASRKTRQPGPGRNPGGLENRVTDALARSFPY